MAHFAVARYKKLGLQLRVAHGYRGLAGATYIQHGGMGWFNHIRIAVHR